MSEKIKILEKKERKEKGISRKMVIILK